MKNDENIPQLRGFVSSQIGQQPMLHVYCPYCKKLHTHGWGDGGARQKPGMWKGAPRVSHCDNNSPWYGKIYYIRPHFKKDLTQFYRGLKLWGYK